MDYYQSEELAFLEEEEFQQMLEKARIANNYVQELNDYLNRHREHEGNLKIYFPKGHIRTVEAFREVLRCIDDQTIKTNISYSLLLSDLFTWLIHRTDIFGVLREMIIKQEIVIMAAICETLIVLNTSSRKRTYKSRIDQLIEKGTITENLKDDLIWLWDKRSGIHIFEMKYKESGIYSVEDFNRAKDIGTKFVNNLNKKKVR